MVDSGQAVPRFAEPLGQVVAVPCRAAQGAAEFVLDDEQPLVVDAGMAELGGDVVAGGVADALDETGPGR